MTVKEFKELLSYSSDDKEILILGSGDAISNVTGVNTLFEDEKHKKVILVAGNIPMLERGNTDE